MLIRTRLTVYFALLVAVVLGAFGYVVFEVTRTSVLAEIQRDVRVLGEAAAAAVRTVGGDPDEVPLNAVAGPDAYVQLVDQRGVVLARSASLQGRVLPFLPADFHAGRVIEIHDDAWPLYVHGQRVVVEADPGYVVVGRSPGTLYAVLGRLRSVLVPAFALAVAAASLVIWIVVRQATGPLVRLAAAAEDITARQDHGGRIRSSRRTDEIGRLAATINDMLAALERSHRQVQDSNEAQRRFLADVSHQLRAPLTIMLSSLELVEKVGADDPAYAKQLLDDLRAETKRMARMVTQLLVIARVDSSAPALQRPLLIGEITADLCRQWKREPSDVAFQAVGMHDLSDVVVAGNEDQLRELLQILMENAFKYTPAGGRVTLHGAVTDAAVRISVIDTGIGIRRDDLRHIFDRFFRSETARRRHGDGTGLGLAIGQHLAERHGGSITVDSTPGAGSRFTVTLPLLVPNDLVSDRPD